MITVELRSAAFVVAVASVALVSCSADLEPCGGGKKGDRYRIEVIGLAESDLHRPPFSHAEWGFAPGAVVEGTVADLRGDEFCKSSILDAPGIGDWTWELSADTGGQGGHRLAGWYGASNGGCSGEVGFRFPSLSEDDCIPSVDELCRLDMFAEVASDPDGVCPESCTNILDVHIEKL